VREWTPVKLKFLTVPVILSVLAKDLALKYEARSFAEYRAG
jgi:hypothetical protein